jgi:hypothetical protein
MWTHKLLLEKKQESTPNAINQGGPWGMQTKAQSRSFPAVIYTFPLRLWPGPAMSTWEQLVTQSSTWARVPANPSPPHSRLGLLALRPFARSPLPSSKQAWAKRKLCKRELLSQSSSQAKFQGKTGLTWPVCTNPCLYPPRGLTVIQHQNPFWSS